MIRPTESPARAEYHVSDEGRALRAELSGEWRLAHADGAAKARQLTRELGSAGSVERLVMEGRAVGGWDSSLLAFVLEARRQAEQRSVSFEVGALPEGAVRLLALADAVPERTVAREAEHEPVIDRVGQVSIEAGRSMGEALDLVGSLTWAALRMLRGGARFRAVDLASAVQRAGAGALGIVTLVSFLLGLILAFVAAVQLEQFGATIYVADLVGIAMVRDMGALMTGIVMAGRSGAAFAAEIGSMKVTQEIDALTTMAISPVEYLVLPRTIALVAMMPLLTVYSDMLGILGGLAVAAGMLDLSPTLYLQQTGGAVGVDDLVGGMAKSVVYGGLVAFAGCLRGLQAERSSSGVGEATTSAVVTGIVAIIAACGLFQFVYYVLGI